MSGLYLEFTDGYTTVLPLSVRVLGATPNPFLIPNIDYNAPPIPNMLSAADGGLDDAFPGAEQRQSSTTGTIYRNDR